MGGARSQEIARRCIHGTIARVTLFLSFFSLFCFFFHGSYGGEGEASEEETKRNRSWRLYRDLPKGNYRIIVSLVHLLVDVGHELVFLGFHLVEAFSLLLVWLSLMGLSIGSGSGSLVLVCLSDLLFYRVFLSRWGKRKLGLLLLVYIQTDKRGGEKSAHTNKVEMVKRLKTKQEKKSRKKEQEKKKKKRGGNSVLQ
jgi:hypothetical protein